MGWRADDMITQASEYTWVTNAADLGICGDILPARDVNGTGSQLMKKEDIAFICEAIHEKMLGDSYPSYIPRTVNYITLGRNIYDAIRGVFDNYTGFKWYAADQVWRFDDYYGARRAKFVDDTYVWNDIPYAEFQNTPYYTIDDIYPDCWMTVDWIGEEHGTYQSGPEEYYISHLGIRYPGYYDANDAWHPSMSATVNFFKADQLRKIYYFLERSNHMVMNANGGGMDWVNADCDQNTLYNDGVVRIDRTQAPTQTWNPNASFFPPNRLTRQGGYTSSNPTYQLVGVAKDHGDHPSQYEWQYSGYVAESWVENVSWRIKTFAKFKWVKMLIQEYFYGNVSDSDTDTATKNVYGWRWVDMTKVTSGVAADEVGTVWTVPSNLFSRDYCRNTAIANGFANLANWVNGSDTTSRRNLPRFYYKFDLMDLRGEIDAKCEIESLNWQWTPYPPVPDE